MATEPPRDITKPNGGNLCATCSVISFNDEKLASFIVTQDIREPCWDIAAAAGSYPRGYADSLTGGRFPLDYTVVDFLPTLPCLEQSALRGCEFCSILRLEIIRAEFNYTGFAQITLVYRSGWPDFLGLGVAALVAQLTWLPHIPSIPPASPSPGIHRDCIIFALESDSADVASWLKIPGLRNKDPLCEENIQFMTGALADCVQNCSHYIATDFLPSRLLDLGPQTSLDSIRLIDSSQIARKDRNDKPKYAALSYCWGPPLATGAAEQLSAKVGSMESMRRRVPKKGTSRVILDAIKVCKALSIQYLWVDSLCIIQDEISDWEKESASMTLIYSNAFVTISTPSSSASNEGFLVRHRRQVTVPFQSRVVPSINGHYNLVASGTCSERALYGWPDLDISDTSWDSRGWTLQESEMSNRLLIFGKSMIHFQCRHTVSENGYRQETSVIPTRMVEALDDSHSDLKEPNSTWRRILNSYGIRLFTFVEDKLPAISGMAKFIADRTGDEYVAGLWKTELPSSLVWHTNPHHNTNKYHAELPDLLNVLRSPTPYITPSWSPVRLHVGIDQGTFPAFYSGVSAESTVVDASVISVGDNPFGRVQHGRIRIQGRIAPVLSDLAMLQCYKPFALWCNRDRGAITYYELDWAPVGGICNRGELLMLLIASTRASESSHTRHHGGSLEAAHHCCTNDPDDSTESSFTGSESQAGQHSDEAEIEGGLSLSTKLAVARISEEVGTEAHGQAGPDGEDELIQSETGPDGSSGSEEGSRSPSLNNRDACGLLIHRLSGTDTYVRVGVWTSMVEDDGGTALFEGMDIQEIDIV